MAGLTSVEPLSESFKTFAAKFAQTWGVALGPTPKGPGVRAVVSEVGVGLQFNDPALGKKPYYADFVDLGWKGLFTKGLPKTHIFRKALGAHDGEWTVLDATAGFGGDAMLAMICGAQVTAIEKSPVVAEMLRGAVSRASSEYVSFKAKLAKFKIVNADSAEYLKKLKPADAPDVVYLDPMFDKPKKTAKSPKEMQLLQALLGDPPSAADELALFQTALQLAKKRVVVKRALKAQAIAPSPASSFKGQSVRYDVYLKK
jgi:16S rRNA (guanine1516-N2)-methyltransferase